MKPVAHFKSLFFKAAAVSGAAFLPLMAAAGMAAPLTIHPLGDSITFGYTTASAAHSPGGYREPLHRSLVLAGVRVDFVGANTGNPGPLLTQADDTEHDGYPKYTIMEVFHNLDGNAPPPAILRKENNRGGYWLTGTGDRPPIHPDIILLLIGTNDIEEGAQAPEIEQRLDLLIAKIFALRPAAHLYVASVPPYTLDAAKTAVAKEYGRLIRTRTVPNHYNRGRKITFVDQYANFILASSESGDVVNSALFGDTLHPNEAGYQRMGESWAAAILRNLASGDSAVVYDSGSFEPTRFVAGVDLDGQDAPPAGNGPWQKDDGTSAATVHSNHPRDGVQSIRVERDGTAGGDTRWGVVKTVTPNAATNLVIIDVQMRVNLAVLGMGPLFGLEAYDASEGVPKVIGRVMLDASSGDVLYSEAGTGRLLASGRYLSRNEYHGITLSLDFSRRTYSIHANGNLVRTEGFVDPSATVFTDAPIATLAAADAAETGITYFENYVISQRGAPPAPAAPTALTAVAESSSRIRLNWTDNSVNESAFLVERSAGDTNFVQIASVSRDTTLFEDAGLPSGTTFHYRVRARNSGGDSDYSNVASATTGYEAPAAPGGLTATPGNEEIVLKWSGSEGAESYNVKRALSSGGPYTPIATGVTAIHYTDTGLRNGTAYYYVVSAVNIHGESSNSFEASAVPREGLASRYPFEGSAEDASGNANHGSATLVTYVPGKMGGQAAQFDGAASHVQIPRVVGTNFTVAMWVRTTETGGAGAQWWSGKGLVDGEVSGSAMDWGTAVLNSRFVMGIGSPDTTIASTIPINDGNWHHVAATRDSLTGEVRIFVDGVLSTVGSGPAGVRTAAAGLRVGSIQTGSSGGFLNGSLDEVRLYDRVLTGAEIAVLADGTPLPDVPSALTATGGEAQVSLSWAGSAWAERYNVKRSETSGGPYTLVAEGVASTGHIDAGLESETTYYYVVSAVNTNGESANSSEAGATTLPVGMTFSGQATVLAATILGVSNSWSGTGPLPPEGGARESALLQIHEPGVLSATVAHASTVGQADRTRSEASAANIEIVVGDVTVQCDFVMARASAVWSPGGTLAHGESEIANLVVAGVPVVVTGEPNQRIPLLNGYLVINEQSASSNSITVSALRLVISGVADVVAALAEAGIASESEPPMTGTDYVSGGGWIPGTPGGGRGNFGVEGGIEDGVLFGHLTYRDQELGMWVEAVNITSYRAGSLENSRRIEGTAEINGEPGHGFVVEVTDNGEPGREDTFDVRLSNGYEAAGRLGGGNIQLHQPGR